MKNLIVTLFTFMVFAFVCLAIPPPEEGKTNMITTVESSVLLEATVINQEICQVQEVTFEMLCFNSSLEMKLQELTFVEILKKPEAELIALNKEKEPYSIRQFLFDENRFTMLITTETYNYQKNMMKNNHGYPLGANLYSTAIFLQL